MKRYLVGLFVAVAILAPNFAISDESKNGRAEIGAILQFCMSNDECKKLITAPPGTNQSTALNLIIAGDRNCRIVWDLSRVCCYIDNVNEVLDEICI